MVWQDVVIAVVQFGFTAALVPTIVDRRAVVPWSSSLMTFLGLVTIAACFATLGLWLSTAGSTANGTAWLLILLLRRRRR